MSKLTLEEVKAMTGEILASAPKTRFLGSSYDPPTCIYFYKDSGKPCCVVGHVFSRIGIGPDQLVHPFSNVNPNTTRIIGIPGTWQGKISEGAADWLGFVQDRQDGGLSWGEIYAQEFGENHAENQ